ncbi:MAG: hypothetical protein A3H28_14655 [Acidobacteria bacterium RIFCSPLOWO2_02_FULL_61_28]|nr:MAG: hypothetical protein A3H28_14655 [Acidobacteria bacterium RIFCSPLOWO2_02_FULL_61_28]
MYSGVLRNEDFKFAAIFVICQCCMEIRIAVQQSYRGARKPGDSVQNDPVTSPVGEKGLGKTKSDKLVLSTLERFSRINHRRSESVEH